MTISGSNQPYYVRSLLMGYTWTGTVGIGASVTYSYDMASWAYGTPLGDEINGVPTLLNSSQRTAVDKAFSAWSNVANINFQNVGTSLGDNTNIVLRQADFNYGIAGSAYPTAPSSVWTTGDLVQRDDILFDNYYIANPNNNYDAYVTVLHEIGHALGLKHAHDNGLDGNQKLPASEDSYRATVMSYNAGIQSGSPISTTVPLGPMIYDIAAIQYLYGANTTYHAGNDTYILDGANSLSGVNFAQRGTYPFADVGETIWDAGGVDTLDASSYSERVVLNLREGLQYYSMVGRHDIWNAFGSNIENARSGAGNDSLHGNNLNNLLEGGTGNDEYYFYGSSFGTDTISDTVGTNKIFINSAPLFGTALVTATSGLYNLISGGVEYALTKTAGWLQIAAVNAVNSVIKILNFQNNDFGIFLSDNHLPTAVADSITISENASQNINVLANDSDSDNDTLSVSSINTAGTIGLVSINADNTIKYNTNGKFDYLAAGKTATDTFKYTASDGKGGTATQTVTVTVTGANDAPSKMEVRAVGSVDYNNLSASHEFRVNTTIGSAYTSSLASLSNGNFIVTWANFGQDGFGVYGQILDSSGLKIGNEFQINTYNDSTQWDPSTAVLSNGNFVVTWASSGQDGSGDGVYAQIFNEAGQKIGAEFKVNTYTLNYQHKSSITPLNNGNFVVTWTSSGQDGSGDGVYAQIFNEAGQKIGAELSVNTYTGSTQWDSSVAFLSNDSFVVTWASSGQDGSGYGVYAQIFNGAGQKIGAEFRVNTYTLNYQGNPSITTLTNGNFVITWESFNQTGSAHEVFAQIFNSSGQKIGNEFQVNTFAAGIQDQASVVSLNNGNFIVTWQSYDQDGSGYGVYAQLFDELGQKIGVEFLVNDTLISDQSSPKVLRLTNGDIAIIWEGNGTGDSSGIFAKILKAPNTDLKVTENANGAVIGDIKITDIDTNDTHTYAVSDSRFEVVTDQTGVHLKLKSGVSLDYEAGQTVNVNITATDAGGLSISQQVTIKVNDIAEIITDAVNDTITLTETNGGGATEGLNINVLTNDTYVGAASINIVSIDKTGIIGDANIVPRKTDINGNVIALPSISYSQNGKFDYLGAGETATDSFKYTISDGNGGTDTATVTITITGENDAPVIASAIAAQSGLSGNLFTYTIPTTSFSDIDGDALAYSAMLADGNALPEWLNFNAQTRTFSGVAPSGAAQVLAVKVVASDGSLSAFQNFNINLASNIINGTSGAETINGTANNDEIYGFEGNDSLKGNAGADFLFAGNGDDGITGGAGADYIDGGAGWDVASYTDSTAAININLATNTNTGGTAEGDRLFNIERVFGSSFNDSITGSINNDTLYGNNGNDQLFGGTGNDTLYGENGDDVLSGGTGNDTLNGNAGVDRFVISTSPGSTTTINDFNIAGETVDLSGVASTVPFVLLNKTAVGTDTHILLADNQKIILKNIDPATLTAAHFVGLLPTNLINGTAVGEALNGTSGIDEIYGLDGNDSLKGNAGNDFLIGGAGDDGLTGGAGADFLDGGAGWDVSSYTDSTAAININLATNIHTGGTAEGDKLFNIERIFGSAFNDVMLGGSGNDSLYGNNGNDNLNGGSAGNDSLFGENGDDTLTSGSGNDTLTGGAGIDRFIITTSANSTITIADFSLATETIDLSGVTGIGPYASLAKTAVGNDTHIALAAGQKIVLKNIAPSAINYSNFTGIDEYNVMNGTSAAESLNGTNFADKIYGLDGNDALKGNASNDFLYGGNGDDSLTGGAGADFLDGGDGWDTASYTDSTASVTVNLATNQNYGGFAEGDSLFNIERIFGSGYNDDITGSDNNDTLLANSGNDIVRGGGGNDGLYGENGDDILFGDAGNDTLNGSAGNDQLQGGLGRDTLTGGAGLDSFVFDNISDSTFASFDTITDFTQGQDIIDFSALDTFGIHSFSDLNIVTTATKTIIEDKSTTINPHTSTNPDFHVELTGVFNLQDGDFGW